MNPKSLIVVGLILGAGFWWWNQSDDPIEIITAMTMDEDSITFDDVRYDVAWSPSKTTYSGDLRALLTEYNPYAPFNTHIAMVTNGDFSNPDYVIVKDGKVEVNASLDLGRDVEGDVTVLHLVPKNLSVLGSLQNLRVGQKVTLVGKEEADGNVRGSNGKFVNFGTKGSGRPLVLLSEVKIK